MDHVIEIERLCKSFGKTEAVRDLSFSVAQGELFAFLGVNGAGKSTTIRILCGTLQADSGEARILGRTMAKDPVSTRAALGVVFQSSVLDRALSVRENLKSRAALYGIRGKAFADRLNELACLLDFVKLLDRPVARLSGGERRRVDIARALLHRPQILILDEPTTGLDPQTRKLLWDVIETLRAETGLTVFLTTHYMEEAARADTVVIIDSGRIVAHATPLELKNAYTRDKLYLYGVSEDGVRALNVPFTAEKEAFVIELNSPADAVKLICAHPELFSDFELEKGKMDDVFLAATGKALTSEEA